jgi:protein-tyrosine phosphatase/membrane-associated phospholipid phosphatase
VGNLHGVGGATARPRLIEALATAIYTSVYFCVVYSSTNWIAAHRTDVGSWYFPWEMDIPFVPLMIIPYMSIDFFFFGAPFLCDSRAEMRTLARRILLGITIAGVFFLVMPLKLAYPRPVVTGWLGAIYNPFLANDAPYNLFPSLHITLRTILARHYVRHTRGLVRWAARIWFSLIGFSTVLTHQHQLVDVAGGFILAGFCFYLVRESPERLPVIANRRVGAYYALAAAVVLVAAVTLRPWGTFLLWPAAGLGLVTAGYYKLGPTIYGKQNASLPWSTRFVLAPVLLGQHLSLAHYRRQCRPWDEVVPGLRIGRVLNRDEATEVVRQGVTAVLDLTAEFSEARPFTGVEYLNLPILDLTAPTRGDLDTAVSFITEQVDRGTVYVHCKIGYSRTAAVVACYLLASGKAKSPEEAMELLRTVRPSIVIRPEARRAIVEYANSRP